MNPMLCYSLFKIHIVQQFSYLLPSFNLTALTLMKTSFKYLNPSPPTFVSYTMIFIQSPSLRWRVDRKSSLVFTNGSNSTLSYPGTLHSGQIFILCLLFQRREKQQEFGNLSNCSSKIIKVLKSLYIYHL